MEAHVTPSPFCLAGATATGKSAVVQLLAERYGAAILSADAMLVYQGMDIGTAKPSLAERAAVPYFGLDLVTPAERCTVATWLDHATQARAKDPDRPLFVTGGTGLYFSALLRGLDPAPPANPDLRAELEACSLAELQARLARHEVTIPDMANPRRLVRALEIFESGHPLPDAWTAVQKPALLALTWERAALHARIAERVERMYAEGLLEETHTLRKTYPEWSQTAQQAIGYAEALAVLDGSLSEAEAKERTVIRTRQLARRQETYLRHQFEITFLPADGLSLDQLAERVARAWKL